jgi:sec-independent protein translocase protein TatC
MTLFEHLAELRRRVVISAAAVLVGGVIVYIFYDPVFHFLVHPYHSYLVHHPSKNISNGQLVATSPLEAFLTRLKISLYGGLILGSPVVLWQLWRFITPGLHKNEKRYALPFVVAAVALFATGVATAIVVFPRALNWLINAGGPVVPLYGPGKYVGLYAAMCVVFGAVFMYPLVLVFLQLAEVVPSSTWRRWRRVAIVVIAVVAAVITPSSDPFSFFALAVPMYVLYEGSIVVGRLLKK